MCGKLEQMFWASFQVTIQSTPSIEPHAAELDDFLIATLQRGVRLSKSLLLGSCTVSKTMNPHSAQLLVTRFDIGWHVKWQDRNSESNRYPLTNATRTPNNNRRVGDRD